MQTHNYKATVSSERHTGLGQIWDKSVPKHQTRICL